MKKTPLIKVLLSVVFFLFLFSANVFGYKELIIENRGNKAVRVIKIVLDGEHFVVNSIAYTGGNTLDELTNQVGGDTALNGVFFCPADYTQCNGTSYSEFERVFKGDGKSYSKYWPDTGVRTIFGFTKDGEPLVVQNNESEMAGFWSNINNDRIQDLYFGLGNFPTLLLEGIDVSYAYRYEIDTKMLSKTNRHFICWTENKKTVYLGVIGAIKVTEMPDYLSKNFDCWNALNLDAGYSAGMIYEGKVIHEPHRKIMDARVVLNKYEYQRLTNYIPSSSSGFVYASKTNKNIKITEQDQQKINIFVRVIKQISIKKGNSFKWEMINLVRELVSQKHIQKNSYMKGFLNSLLIELFTIRKMEI